MELVSLALRLLFSKGALLHRAFTHDIRITSIRTKGHTQDKVVRTLVKKSHQKQTMTSALSVAYGAKRDRTQTDTVPKKARTGAYDHESSDAR